MSRNLELDFINTIERLSKSQHLRGGNIIKYTEEILKESSIVLDCERTNAWTFSDDKNSLISLNSYAASKDNFSIESDLSSITIPNYFTFLKRGEIIVSNNAREAEINTELIDVYIDHHHITSMIDVPIRSEGEMIGVLCFEHVKKEHVWTLEEQKFAQSITQLLSLALEANKKRKYLRKLEKSLKEKEVIMAEVNHRVKNNMAAIISILKLQKYKCKDEYNERLFEEVINKVYSMSAIQDRLHMSQDLSEIKIKGYIIDLITNLKNTYNTSNEVKFDLSITDLSLDIVHAVPFGLITNEIATNSFKYAFDEENLNPRLFVSCDVKDDKIHLRMKDNGKGSSNTKSSDGMGLELVKNLTKQLNGTMEISFENGMDFSLIF